MLLAPRHVPCLRQPKIHVHVSRQANVIPWACFARIGVPETLVNRLDIATAAAEKLWGSSTDGAWGPNSCWASVDRGYRSYVGLDVPVGCPAGVVERRASWQSGVPAEDAGELPSPKDRLHCPIVRVQEGSALAEWHLPHGSGSDDVPDVEVGVAVVAALANRIFDKRPAIVLTAVAKVRLQPGGVVQRMGEAVIEVQSQTAEALSQRNRQSVVVGIPNRAPCGQCTILRLNEPRG